MFPGLLHSLQAHRPNLRARWERKLRALPPSSPLAEPDALVHLMDWTLDNFFKEVQVLHRTKSGRSVKLPYCPCGLNPLTTYFVTAEDALCETLFMEEPGWINLEPEDRENELQHLRESLRKVAAREIASFCSVCRHNTDYQEDDDLPEPIEFVPFQGVEVDESLPRYGAED